MICTAREFGALIDINGHGIAALIIVAVVFVIAIAVGARLLRPTRFRVARMGVFIERQRFDDDPEEPEAVDPGATQEWPKPPLDR
jgi:hypothetical protein